MAAKFMRPMARGTPTRCYLCIGSCTKVKIKYRPIHSVWHVGEVVEERWKMSPTTISLKRPSCSVTSKFHLPVELVQCVAFLSFI